MMASNPWAEGIELIVLRTVNDQLSLWGAIVPSELLVLPDELVRVDRLLDDPAFFARSCRTSTRVSVVPT